MQQWLSTRTLWENRTELSLGVLRTLRANGVARPRIVERYRELIPLAKGRAKQRFAEFFDISESMTKLGTPWEPSVVERHGD
ncbi:MAG: hypothetical protein KDA72_03680 [Planctomycetales bacterium]|nr:hypothetical protein [Planctomycetales bacterium]